MTVTKNSDLSDVDSFVPELTKLVAEEKGVNPLNLPQLYYTIDPEAILDLFESNNSDKVKITFHYAGFEVEVTGKGKITVRSQSESEL